MVQASVVLLKSSVWALVRHQDSLATLVVWDMGRSHPAASLSSKDSPVSSLRVRTARLMATGRTVHSVSHYPLPHLRADHREQQPTKRRLGVGSATKLLPGWIRRILGAQNPDHPALKMPSEAISTKGKRRASGTVAPGSSVEPVREHKKLRGRTAAVNTKGEGHADEREKASQSAEHIHFPFILAPAGPYSNDWYKSPLDDPRFGEREIDWDAAREALRVLPEIVQRARADFDAIHAFLRDVNQLPEQIERKEQGKKNPFYGKYA